MERLNEVIEIIEKTGDKCIILKENSSLVMMNLDDYKELLNLTSKDSQKSAGKPKKFPITPAKTPNLKEFEIPEEDVFYPEPVD